MSIGKREIGEVDSTVWVIDRPSFKSILMHASIEKVKAYIQLMNKVHLDSAKYSSGHASKSCPIPCLQALPLPPTSSFRYVCDLLVDLNLFSMTCVGLNLFSIDLY